MNQKPRPISAAEAELVRWLLANTARIDHADALLPQVEGLLVAERCDCGCPSVEFLVEGLSATASIVAEARGTTPEAEPVGVLLWARAGRLSGLEIYDLGDRVTISLPSPSELRSATLISSVE
jgi:hypothetical protein